VAVLAESSEKSDLVVLRTPRGNGSLPVMRVVIGGMASRHALPVDKLDDLALALETLFREEPVLGGDLTLTVSVEAGTFVVTLGGLSSPLVRRTLSGESAESGLGPAHILRMIMDALVDGYRTADCSSAASFAVEMKKRIV
jgi:hypothetical protein